MCRTSLSLVEPSIRRLNASLLCIHATTDARTMPFAPLDSASVIRTLWAPQVIYEPGNPRQYVGLSSIHDDQKRYKGKTAAQVREARRAQQRYAWKRDVTNVLRATTSRYIWDYQAEALTLSDEEAEWEAEVREPCYVELGGC